MIHYPSNPKNMKDEEYIKQLDKDYAEWMTEEAPPSSKLEFIGEFVFDFTTYDGGEGSELEALTKDMLEVIRAIYEKRTFEYIENEQNSRKYFTMVNMPFLKDKLEWGTSIRGAWIDNFNKEIELDCERIVIKERELEQFIEQMLRWVDA